MIKPPYHGAGRLTPSVYDLLKTMKELDEEAVQEGIEVWVDLRRFHAGTVHKALQLCALRDVSDDTGALRRYVLNDIGLAILDDPEQADKVIMLLALRRNMTVRGGKVVEFD